MGTISPKTFAELDFFATMSQMGVAHSALKIFSAFLTISQLCLPYPVLKILENWKKKHKFFFIKFHIFLKSPTLILLRRGVVGGEVKCNSTFIFSEVGHEKTKPNRWVERNPKMRNIHSCHCLQKFSKYEKTSPSVFMGLKQSVSRYDVLQVGN